MSDPIEEEIVQKGLVAPRITPTHIEDCIVGSFFFTPAQALGAESFAADSPLKLLTICVLILRNGFTVTGESACASPQNFDPELGKKIARQHAVEKIWPLEGYLLKQRLSEATP